MFLETRRFQKYILFYAYFQYFSIYKTFSHKNHWKVNKFFMGTNFQFRGLHEFLKTIQTEIKHSNHFQSCFLPIVYWDYKQSMLPIIYCYHWLSRRLIQQWLKDIYPLISCSVQERVFDRFHTKWGKGGVFLLNILKITCEKYIFLESSSSKEHFGIIFSLYRAKLRKLQFFGPIFCHLKYDIFISFVAEHAK